METKPKKIENKLVGFSNNEQAKRISDLISTALLKKGASMKNEVLALTSTELQEIIGERFPDLTLEKLTLIFKKGVLGDYGEYYGINFVSIYNWIKEQYALESRIEAKRRNDHKFDDYVSDKEAISLLIQNIEMLPSLQKLLKKYGCDE